MDRHVGYLQMLDPGANDWGSRNVAPNDLSVVRNEDMAEMLRAFGDGSVTYEQLLDWTNLVLFNDAFMLESDELRDCLDCVEESDEPGNKLSTDEVARMIDSLG